MLFIYSLLVKAAHSLPVQIYPVRATAAVDGARFYTPVSVWYHYFFFPFKTLSGRVTMSDVWFNFY